jgi:hypothetical protein
MTLKRRKYRVFFLSNGKEVAMTVSAFSEHGAKRQCAANVIRVEKFHTEME